MNRQTICACQVKGSNAVVHSLTFASRFVARAATAVFGSATTFKVSMIFASAVVCWHAASCWSVAADHDMTIVVPNWLQDVEGNTSAPDYSGPFRAQGIFFAEDFGQLPPTHRLITGIAPRPDVGVVDPRSVEWLDTVWVFSTNPSTELSSSISANHGPDATLVYQGDLFLRTEADGPDDGPQAFDYRVEFQTPFPYNPVQGNLIWEIQAPSGYSPSLLDDQQDHGMTVQIANIDMSDEANLFFTRGLIAQFTFGSTAALGDFDADGQLGLADIDALTSAVRMGIFDARFDVNNDRQLGEQDRIDWVQQLKKMWFGDADLDGSVQFGDFLLLASHFGQPGGWGDGDFDGTGDTQFADFLLLSENFGRGPSPTVSIPEPLACHLALVGLLGLTARHRVRSIAHGSPGRLALAKPVAPNSTFRKPDSV